MLFRHLLFQSPLQLLQIVRLDAESVQVARDESGSYRTGVIPIARVVKADIEDAM
jgi:hypothetical protein